MKSDPERFSACVPDRSMSALHVARANPVRDEHQARRKIYEVPVLRGRCQALIFRCERLDNLVSIPAATGAADLNEVGVQELTKSHTVAPRRGGEQLSLGCPNRVVLTHLPSLPRSVARVPRPAAVGWDLKEIRRPDSASSSISAVVVSRITAHLG